MRPSWRELSPCPTRPCAATSAFWSRRSWPSVFCPARERRQARGQGSNVPLGPAGCCQPARAANSGRSLGHSKRSGHPGTDSRCRGSRPASVTPPRRVRFRGLHFEAELDLLVPSWAARARVRITARGFSRRWHPPCARRSIDLRLSHLYVRPAGEENFPSSARSYGPAPWFACWTDLRPVSTAQAKSRGFEVRPSSHPSRRPWWARSVQELERPEIRPLPGSSS